MISAAKTTKTTPPWGVSTSEQIRISAKNLGALALPNFCPRCFWIKLRLRNRLPFQIFPGIFSTIDSYSKRLIHSWFDRHGKPPAWLSDLGELSGYVEPPHFSKFNIVDEETNILLTGAPDGVLVRPDGSHLIVDYKTSRFTENQDALFPLYATQLNGYAMIGEQTGLSPVSGLALIYTEPVTDDITVDQDEQHHKHGFVMGFSAHVVWVDLDPDSIRPLLVKTREIYGMTNRPDANPGCKDCEKMNRLAAMFDHADILCPRH